MEWNPILGEEVIVNTTEEVEKLQNLNLAINEQLIEEFYLEKEYTSCKIAPIQIYYLPTNASSQTIENYRRTMCMTYYQYMNYGGFNKNIKYFHKWGDVSDHIKSEVLYCLNLLNDIDLIPYDLNNDPTNDKWNNYTLKFANAIYMYNNF